MTLLEDITKDPTTLIAALALVVSIASIIIGFLGLWIQRKHNQLSVKPLGNIGLFDGVDEVGIAINNNGTGPMIIKSVETHNADGTRKKYPIDWIPQELQPNVVFWRDLENVALVNGAAPVMLFLNRSDVNDTNQVQRRDKIRHILNDLTISITYTDIYGNEQPQLIKNLDFFGRER